jgi:hypothetical protein
MPIILYDPSGAVRARTTWPCSQATLPARVADSIVSEFSESFVRDHRVDRAVAEREVRAQLGNLSTLPVLADLRLAQDGSVWVTPYTTASEGPRRWTRVIPSSNTRMTVDIPAKHELVGIVSANVFWTQTLDEDGVPTIHRLRR